MFCRNCGTAMADDAKFCASCGTPVEAAPAAAPQAAPVQEAAPQEAAPQEAAPQETAPQAAPAKTAANDPAATVKGIMHFIVGGVAVLALIFGILNLFGLYNVSVSVYGFSNSGPVSDLYEVAGSLMIGNILYGLGSLIVAAIGALYFLKVQMKNDLYDKFVGKYANGFLAKLVAGDGIATLIGAVGGVFGILQLFFYLIASPMGASVSMSIFSWLMLIIYIALFVCDMFWLNKKQK